jgi:predicted metal-dependent hydrolase
MTLTNPEFARGVELFNHAHFFDAHEVLEDLWRPIARDAPLRRHLQGVVQVAVAFHHESTGNYVGARSVLARALRNLNGAENSFPSLDLDRLRADLALWLQFLLHPPGMDPPKKDQKHPRSRLPARRPEVKRQAVPPMPTILAR